MIYEHASARIKRSESRKDGAISSLGDLPPLATVRADDARRFPIVPIRSTTECQARESVLDSQSDSPLDSLR